MRKNTKKTAVSGLSIHNLSAEDVGEAMDWRRELNPPASLGMRGTFCRAGLQNMIETAMAVYEKKSGKFLGRDRGYLPWNLAGAGAPWWSLPWKKNFALTGGVKNWVREKHPNNENLKKFVEEFARRGNIVEYTARFAGWLKIAGGKRGLVKAIMANTGNGMGSPYTTVNPFHIFDRWPSPHRAERQIWKVRRRANQILRPYGISVSWKSLGEVLAHGPRKIGRAAVVVAGYTVELFLSAYGGPAFMDPGDYWADSPKISYRAAVTALKMARGMAELKNHPEPVQRWAVGMVVVSFPTIREALANASRLVQDETDGVELYIDPQTKEIIHGVSCVRGWMAQKPSSFGDNGQMFLLRQKHTGRSYHCNHGYYHHDCTPRQAVKEAIKAWRKQDGLADNNADLIAFLGGDKKGFCPLIFPQDSQNAGNCHAGTTAWLKNKGWELRKWIPGSWLIPYLGESLVRNVAMEVYLELAESR